MWTEECVSELHSITGFWLFWSKKPSKGALHVAAFSCFVVLKKLPQVSPIFKATFVFTIKGFCKRLRCIYSSELKTGVYGDVGLFYRTLTNFIHKLQIWKNKKFQVAAVVFKHHWNSKPAISKTSSNIQSVSLHFIVLLFEKLLQVLPPSLATCDLNSERFWCSVRCFQHKVSQIAPEIHNYCFFQKQPILFVVNFLSIALLHVRVFLMYVETRLQREASKTVAYWNLLFLYLMSPNFTRKVTDFWWG